MDASPDAPWTPLALLLSGMRLGVLIIFKSSSRVPFRAIIVLRREGHLTGSRRTRKARHNPLRSIGSSMSPVSRRTRPEDISSLFVGSREDTTPRPSTRPTPAPPQVPASTSKRRFRLPLTPNTRTSGLTPPQAEDIDFETRLASYSDDERYSLNRTHGSCQRKSAVAPRMMRGWTFRWPVTHTFLLHFLRLLQPLLCYPSLSCTYSLSNPFTGAHVLFLIK